MSYLNNTDQGSSSGNQMLLFMALALAGFALYTTFFGPEPSSPPPVETSVSAEDSSSQPTVEEAAADVEADASRAEVLAPFRITNRKDRGGATFYVTNVGGRVASAQVDAPAQYAIEAGEREILPSALTCDGEVCRSEGDLSAVDLPLAITLPGFDALTETTVWEFDAEASECTGSAEAQECTLLVLGWTAPDGSLSLRRTYAPDATSPFGLATTIAVRNHGGTARTLQDLGVKIYGEWSAPKGGMFNQVDSRTEAACGAEGRFRDREAKKLKEPQRYTDRVRFAGINERYFVSALIPRDSSGASKSVDSCVIKQADRHQDTVLESGLFSGAFTVPARSVEEFSYAYVAAPKRIEYLKRFDADLEKSVKFGMFAFLAYGIRWLLVFFYSLVHNWGIAILLLTLAIKAALWPVTTKSFRSMEKMKTVQPKIEELKKKYENDQQKLAEAQMKLFREEGINPLSGCLPLVLQMPIYFALYRTIFSSAELYNAPFLGWITDLSKSDPYYIIPILAGALMIAQVRFAPQAANANPQMKMMQWIMPLMFIPVTLFLPAGLVLYIFANILLSILQQLYIRRTVTDPASAA